MAEPIRIRPAVIRDADALAKVYVDTWRQAYQRIIPRAVLANMSYLRETAQFARQLNRPPRDTRLFVATNSSGKVDGFVNFGATRGSRRGGTRQERTAEIYTLYVSPRRQRQGIGRRLLAETAEQLLADGEDSVVLWVLKDNTAAQAFYRTIGGVCTRQSTTQVGPTRLPIVCYEWHDIAALEAATKPQLRVGLPL